MDCLFDPGKLISATLIDDTITDDQTSVDDAGCNYRLRPLSSNDHALGRYTTTCVVFYLVDFVLRLSVLIVFFVLLQDTWTCCLNWPKQETSLGWCLRVSALVYCYYFICCVLSPPITLFFFFLYSHFWFNEERQWYIFHNRHRRHCEKVHRGNWFADYRKKVHTSMWTC